MIVISAIYNEKKNAGPKAPSDINKILNEKYNAKIITIFRKGNYKIKILMELLKFAIFKRKEIIVIQFPLLNYPFIYKILNKKKTIILIHDLNGLRFNSKKILKDEIEILKQFKYVIAHNNSMIKYLESCGIKKESMYNLQIFDYLTDGEINENKRKEEKCILYTGNLKKEKSPFIYELNDKKMKFNINLYGLGIEKDISEKIKYKGSFEPEKINNLNGNFGLIWDGKVNKKDIAENNYEEYTRYNNPHKLSCYLAIEIPVIAWKESAIAEFIKNNNIGYLIENLYEINDLDISDYDEKRKNAVIIGKKIRAGYYSKKIFEKIINDMEK